MKHINESIIGRRGGDYKSSKTLGQLYLGQDLEYGDIVKLSAMPVYFICLPISQCDLWWAKIQRPHAQVVFVRYVSHLEPSHASYCCDLTQDYEFVMHVREYKYIKTPEDLKRIFDKYNIPYE